METNFYTNATIKAILENFSVIEAETKVDIEEAVESELLNGVQLQILFCLYNAGLNVLETTEILNIKHHVFDREYTEALEIIEAVLNGYPSPKRPKSGIEPRTFYQALSLLAIRKINPLISMNKQTRISLLEITHTRDELAKETLSQLTHGIPLNVYNALFNVPYSPSVYNTYKVDDLYELGLKKPSNGSDAFIKQNYQNNVSYENTFNFVHSADLKGRKKVHYSNDDGGQSRKQNFY